MIKKLQVFDSLNYSLRRLKCEWQETKKNQPEIILNFYHIKFGLWLKFDICTVLHLFVSCDRLSGRMSDCAEIPSNTFLYHSDLQKKKNYFTTCRQVAFGAEVFIKLYSSMLKQIHFLNLLKVLLEY